MCTEHTYDRKQLSISVLLIVVLLIITWYLWLTKSLNAESNMRDEKSNIHVPGKTVIETAIAIAIKEKLIDEKQRFEVTTRYRSKDIYVHFDFLLKRPGSFVSIVLDDKLKLIRIDHGE